MKQLTLGLASFRGEHEPTSLDQHLGGGHDRSSDASGATPDRAGGPVHRRLQRRVFVWLRVDETQVFTVSSSIICWTGREGVTFNETWDRGDALGGVGNKATQLLEYDAANGRWCMASNA